MGREPDDRAIERLLDERGQHLMRAAVALTGSRADGEDLLQAALERLLHNWSRVDTDPEGYLRRTLYNLAADGWRRRGHRRGGSPRHAGPAAAATTAPAAGGRGAPVLGAAHRGGDRGSAGLHRGHGQIRRGTGAA